MSDWVDDLTEDREEYMQRAAWRTVAAHRDTYDEVLPEYREQVISEREKREADERETRR